MLKPISKQSCVTTISMLDTAIDKDRSDLVEYRARAGDDPGCWKDLIKFKDGSSPTVFTIGVVPTEISVRINDECRVGLPEMRYEEAQWKYFLHGLRDIDGWPGDKPKKKEINGVEYIDPEWVRETFVGSLKMVALEVGTKVYLWNQIKDDEVKK